MKINTVTIIGANGAMGSAVAGIFASFGEAKVNIVCRDIVKSKKAVEVAIKSVRAECIKERLVPRTFDNIKECIEESDWIFESVAENYEVKSEINSIIAKYRRPGTIVSTGTSGLSIERLKETFNDEARSLYLGTHFFNPPYNLPLCEVISTQESNMDVVNEICVYLNNKLKRKVIKVKDCAGFLANRVGFQFLNEALKMAELYKDRGGVDYIDAIFGGFTGRGMNPLATIDFVGLDIHKAIIDNVYTNTSSILHDSFEAPTCLEELINQGRIGRKVKQGLYKNIVDENGIKMKLVYDIENQSYREIKKYKIQYVDKMISNIKEGRYDIAIQNLKEDCSIEAEICKELLVKYIVYSLYISNEVAESALDVEIAMVYGFNWISPIGLMNIMGGFDFIEEYLKANQPLREELDILDICEFKKKYVGIKSREDYRKALRGHF